MEFHPRGALFPLLISVAAFAQGVQPPGEAERIDPQQEAHRG